MATTPYFTENELLIKTGRMVQEAQALKSRKVALEDEWGKFTASWRALGRADTGFRVQFDGNSVNVLNPSQGVCVVGTALQAHFDLEAIKRLYSDLEETKAKLSVTEKQLRALGISLA